MLLRSNLIDRAATPTAIAQVASTNCHAMGFSVPPEGKAGVVGISACRAAREGVRHCAGPAPGGVWRKLEHDPLPLPAEISCSVHVSGRVGRQPGLRPSSAKVGRAIGAGESVDRAFTPASVAVRRKFEYDAAAAIALGIVAAAGRGSI